MPPGQSQVEPIETTTKSSKELRENVDGPKRSRFTPQPVETTARTNRRFPVEPIETITRSSKDTPETDEEGPKRAAKFTPEVVESSHKINRRFAPEPVETTTRSSKDQPSAQEKDSKPPRRFAPEPLETSTKTNRRFAPQPIEHSEKKSRKNSVDESENLTSKPRRKFAVEPVETTTKTNRRFAPEPVETSVRSSRKKFADEWDSETAKPRRKFAPEPVETSTKTNRSSRKKFAEEWATGIKKQEKTPRKFAPQLIETAARSRRVPEERPSLKRLDKLKTVPQHDIPGPPNNTPAFDFSQNPLFAEIQRATSPLNRRKTPRCRPSHHCFQIPDLAPIESSESEGETPSPIISPYTCRAYCYEKHYYREPTRMRESLDEQTSGYLLELAAKAAEKQLREQEMAAFPNGNYHEHVDHFVDADDESTGSSEGSTTFNEVNWDLKAMRQYREEQENQEPTSGISPKSHFKTSPWANPAAGIKTDKDIIGHQKDKEIERMRREARPPMLGKDIKYPRCESPEPARFDTTQGCDAVRIAMCYLSEQTQQAEKSEKGESLWCGQGNGKNLTRVSSLWSTASSNHDKKEKEGLWAGCCVKDEAPKGPTGILTPRIETADLLSPCPTPSRGSLLPPTPPASNADFACIDEKLTFALSIDEDFGDDFVTQVYNYLSLGYPSMAQPFDDELSRISNIPVSDLRQDDHLAESKGYIRLGADGNLTDAEITEESCMRWRALRVYIREWAKQHPNMAGDGLGGAGIAARKGSWAV
ncbi:uncharacterized protein N0V89_011779 [Didymosphaeria variabile]|uniref:Uncharacterized protein n=1 Tax=Didymosphaeria variabile TaxID=1932322 RepID=A0A9W9C5P1_9PLEO|nr:uncharacterized protein N0V89_011779 [Didymosphaeria variabile]KAJ4345645.1 hypothetical protein N0V89_011779 [Didymosphaeria variabile]